MEIDFAHSSFDKDTYSARQIEECFEDAFGVRLLPEEVNWTNEARYFLLARDLGGQGLFIVFWSDGKLLRIIAVREMSDQEQMFYQRMLLETT